MSTSFAPFSAVAGRENLSASISGHLCIVATPTDEWSAPAALETRAKDRAAPTSARWQIVVALLHSPDTEGRRLAALLERLPAERRRHALADDVRRRQWRRA